MSSLMTIDHPKWNEFFAKLVSQLDFRSVKGKKIDSYQWDCDGTMEKTTAILKTYRVDVPRTLAYFEKLGGHCDCEVVFNVPADKLGGVTDHDEQKA